MSLLLSVYIFKVGIFPVKSAFLLLHLLKTNSVIYNYSALTKLESKKIGQNVLKIVNIQCNY